MSEMIGINETMDVLEGIQAEAQALINACQDGKINFFDLKYQIEVLSAGRAAFENAQAIPLELRDLDEDEIKILYEEILALGLKVIEAFCAVSKLVAKGR